MDLHEADGVFQGGGVKGLALVGALLGFADHRETSIDKWVNVAGTSAGSIIAALLACGRDPSDLETLLRETPYASFQDWGPGGEVLGGAWNLARHHGLAHGEVFRMWLDNQLDGRTFAAVKRETPAPDPDASPYRLRLIAADVTRKEMLVLPDDLPHYLAPGTTEPIDPDGFRIADAVRMSMSIPYFFQPVELVHAESGDPSTIVDGGILSNFPVWIFDVQKTVPLRPTFGFRLVGGRGVGGGLEHIIAGLGWPVGLGTDIFHTATDAWDTRFMSHSTTVRTCPVPAGTIGTTDFDLTTEQQDWLVSSGRTAAHEFLDQFDVTSYINTFGQHLAPAAATTTT